MSELHPLHFDNSLPPLFTNPFDYVPSEVVRVAARELMRYVESQEQWREELSRGKMFGVLVVRSVEGELFYLAAFSGNLEGITRHSFFVPPIFDLHGENSFFKSKEGVITAINHQIKSLERSDAYCIAEARRDEIAKGSSEKISAYRLFMKESKARRKALRQNSPTTEELAAITRESQHQKGELRRMESHAEESLREVDMVIAQYHADIDKLKTQRQYLSQELQKELFQNYILTNNRAEQSSLYDIFDRAKGALPPAGAGECAAPKLLNYAYTHSLQPVAMGEFWVGESPRGEIRHHGEYYPACESKCRVILNYMLDGVIREPSALNYSARRDLRVVYQDSWLAVVDKPSGVLSVRGRVNIPSVEEQLPVLFAQYPDAKVVHRLDLDTSGLLIVAFTPEVYSELQRQFAMREVHKRYVALLDGVILQDVGEVNLPLGANFEQRPRQRVDYVSGREAVTHYRVLERHESCTRVELSPLTGRTHQLRVHCAHGDGLGVPIIGDRLYGRPAQRLMLHAQQISFCHPMTKSSVEVEFPAEF